MKNGRLEERMRALIGGRIVFNNGAMSYDCIVRNISHSGAKLVLDVASPLPDEFDVILLAHGRRRRAQLTWRTEKEIGVTFLDEGTASAGRVAELETENDVLRRKIAAAMRTMARHALGKDEAAT